MASGSFPTGIKSIIDGNTVFTTDTMKLALMSNTYTPTLTEEFYGDLSAGEEVVATNYTAGGATLAGKSVTVVGSAVEISATSPVFSSLGGGTNDTIIGGIVYKDTGTPGTSRNIWWLETSSSLTTNGGNVTFSLSSPAISFADA